MSHHFDTKLAKEDPTLNVCDFYLFEGKEPDRTVMAMTVNPDVGLSTPDLLHVEGLYAFRFDLDGDLKEDVVFKFRFGAPQHAENDEHLHIQTYQVRRATGDVIRGDGGELLIEGNTSQIHGNTKVHAFVGTSSDHFAGDALALRSWLKDLYEDQRFDEGTFSSRQNFFDRRNVTAIILEVPTIMIGKGKVRAWATASLYGHAPETLVSRWGLPLITNIFLNDPKKQDWKELYNASGPSGDQADLSEGVAEFVEKVTRHADSAANPAEYGRRVAALLVPIALPYELGTSASFDFAGFNGRALADDVMDVMLTLATNKPLSDGVAPDRTRLRHEFPYFGTAYTKDEQVGVTPVPRVPRK